MDQQVSKYHISVSFSFSFSFFFTSKFSTFLCKSLSHYSLKYSKKYSAENTFILSFNWHLDQICLSQNFNKCKKDGNNTLMGLREAPFWMFPYGSDSPGQGKWSKCGIFFIFFEALLWPNDLISSFFLKKFCPSDSKNVFVLVLPHLEPELELFEVDDIGDYGDDDL